MGLGVWVANGRRELGGGGGPKTRVLGYIYIYIYTHVYGGCRGLGLRGA